VGDCNVRRWLGTADIKKGPRYGALSVLRLQRYDVLRLRAFLALRDRELDLLAFRKRLEAAALDGAEMSEYVRSGFLLDKAKARADQSGSEAITYVNQDEVLRKKLLRNFEMVCIVKSALTGPSEYMLCGPGVKVNARISGLVGEVHFPH
jgi:hypothetical protein